jgi:hypothetical protein
VAAFLQKLTTRTTSNNNTCPAGSGLVAAADALPQGYPEAEAALQVMDSSQHAGTSTGSSHTRTTGPVIEGVPCQEELPSSGDGDTRSVDACDAGSEADYAGLTSEPFEAWLQQAEQTAAMLSAAAGRDTLSMPQTGCGSSGSKRTALGADARDAAPSAAASMYHQKLEDMLQAVEQLESELQDRAVPVRLPKTLDQ